MSFCGLWQEQAEVSKDDPVRNVQSWISITS